MRAIPMMLLIISKLNGRATNKLSQLQVFSKAPLIFLKIFEAVKQHVQKFIGLLKLYTTGKLEF